MNATAAQPAAKMTLLVAAWNEEEKIVPFLQSYASLSYPCKELILCAGGTDRTFEQAENFLDPSIVLVRQDAGEGKQRALRRAFPHATGEIIVLTDADCTLEQSSVIRLLEPILSGEESVTNGSCRPEAAQLTNPFVAYQYAAQQQAETILAKRKYQQALLGRNCAMHRSVLEAVHAFEEDVPIGTDSFLAKKIIATGRRIRFVRESTVSTAYPVSLQQYCRQRSRWWRNGILYSWRFRLYKRLIRACFRVAVGVAMVALPLIGLLVWPLFLLWLALFGYAYWNRAQVIRRREEAQGEVPWALYWRLPLFIFADWWASLLTVYYLLAPSHRFRW
jgi:cellulose synthase/poly-beta-1,6-N-acetylglucosamine synthase-like glycosyltransferase